MRGRKPAPASKQIAAGDPRKLGQHKLQEKLNAEPPVTKGLPACPAYLRGRARAAWDFWADELGKMNLDCRPDAMMLEGACLNYAAAIRATANAQTSGGDVIEEPIVSFATGEVFGYRLKKNPWVTIREKSWTLVRAFCSEFGLSPVSRTRLTIDKGDKLPDLAEILNKPRAPRAPTVQ